MPDTIAVGHVWRDHLVDRLNQTRKFYLATDHWARRLAEDAPGTPCHLAAIRACDCANTAWIGAREAVDDFDNEGLAAHRAAHAGMVANLIRFHRQAA